MKKTKIAVVLTEVFDWFFYQQLNILSKHFDLSIMTSVKISQELSNRLGDLEINLIKFPDYGDDPTYFPGLDDLVLGFDIVLLTDRTSLATFQVLKMHYKSKFKLIVLLNNTKSFPFEESRRNRMIRIELSKVVDEYWVQCNSGLQNLEVEGILKEKIIKTRPVIRDCRMKRFDALAKLSLQEDYHYIGFFGEFNWNSQLFDLLNSIGVAKSKYPELRDKIKLILCGYGELSNVLSERAEVLNIKDDVIFLPYSGEMVENTYNVCNSIFYSLKEDKNRHVESIPLIHQAMADKKIILSTRTPGAEAFLGKHRIDYTKGSIASMSKCLYKMCTAKALVNDILNKNIKKIEQLKKTKDIRDHLNEALVLEDQKVVLTPGVNLDEMINQTGEKVAQKEYFEAINLIEHLFSNETLRQSQTAELYRLMGDCFTKLSTYTKAKECYLKSIELDNFSSKPYIGIGTVNILENKAEVAVAHFQKAVSLFPSSEQALQGLGLSLQVLGQIEEAFKWMLEAHKLNPKNISIIYSIIRLGSELSDFECVERVVRGFLKNIPDEWNLQYTLAGLLYRKKEYKESEQIVNEILKFNPNDDKTIKLKNDVEAVLSCINKPSIA